MCGIFGAVRSLDATPDQIERTLSALLMVGVMSEERGRDAAGIALMVASKRRRKLTGAPEGLTSQPVAAIDGALVVKAPGRFRDLPLNQHNDSLTRATILLGHTRAATQGDPSEHKNASPIVAGALLGTHNGDILVKSIPGYKTLAPAGETDTENLYLALSEQRDDRRGMTNVLKSIVGRAALAFVDRSRPNRLYLARTALSPLAYAYTADGDLMYASNPDWFRRIQEASAGRISFTSITLVPEGHLLTIDTLTREVVDVRRFTPVCRESDVRLTHSAVYRGFVAEDKTADLTLWRHRVVTERLPKWPTLKDVPVTLAKKKVVADPDQPTLFDVDDAGAVVDEAPTCGEPFMVEPSAA